jgi:hypothetical protein
LVQAAQEHANPASVLLEQTKQFTDDIRSQVAGREIAKMRSKIGVVEKTAERVGKSDARVTFRLAGMMIDGVPVEAGAAASGSHIALRAENIHIGSDAANRDCQVNAVLIESTYRGTVVDYRLELSDGQQLLAMTTRHVDLPSGSQVSMGFIPLAD